MGFGFSINSGGDFLPFVKLNGKDGRAERSTFDGQNKGSEIISDFVALYDFATLKTGWIHFTDAGAPDKRLVAIGDPMPDRPSEKHKNGIQLVVFLPGGLGCHEITTSAGGVLGALETIYMAALADPKWAAGEVPVVRLTKWNKEGSGLKTFHVPVFEIIDWKARPTELEKHRADPRPRAAMPSTSAPATGSTQMTPPPAAKQPAPASLDFG